MLEARDLAATRGDTTLFSDLGFQLAPGALLRVTGANGSGKTSLLRALCGLLLPAAGQVTWKGESIRKLREEYSKQFVYVGHADGLKGDLTVAENIAFACAVAGLDVLHSRMAAAIALLGLSRQERLPARALSQGQRRRTTLARLVLSLSRPLWILDEPFAALDAEAVDTMQSLVSGHLARGGMVVLTTHQEARIDALSVIDIRLDRR